MRRGSQRAGRARGVLAAALVLLGGCMVQYPVGSGAGGGAGGGAASPAAARAQLTELLNRHRVRAGCRALVWHAGAAGVAQAHSDDMRRRGYFSHTTPEGRTPRDRLAAAGIAVRQAGENIARTGRGASDALQMWLGSSGHRENLEDCGFTPELSPHLQSQRRPRMPLKRVC